MISVPIYKQSDSKWGAKKLGTSGLTMASHGCYTTSLAMVMKNFAISDDPGVAVDKLNLVQAFTPDGLITYDGVMRAYPQLYFKERIYTTCDPTPNIQKMAIDVAIARARRLLHLGQLPILCVDLVGNDGNPDHAVVLVADASNGVDIDFWIHDPAFGDLILFSKRYGDPRKKLYGFVSIIGPPINVPADGDARAGVAIWKASQIAKGMNVQTYSRELIDALL